MRTNAKSSTPTGQAPQATEAQAATADTASPAALAVAEEAAQAVPSTPDATARDEHHGRGGMYVVVNGKRELTGRTEHEASASAPPAAA